MIVLFSSRLHWDLNPNPLSRLLESKRKSGAPVLDLTESNPTQAELSYSGEAILRALSRPESLRYEPQPAGLLTAREAVSGYYRDRGQSVDVSRILLTASTSEAYTYLFKLLTDPGDEILVPRPSYPLFEFLAGMELVNVVPYPLVYHHRWQIDFEALRPAITSRTRAVVVVNPNNPTGSYIKRRELDQLVDLCSSRGLAILSDEVFSDYAYEPDEGRVSSLAGVDSALTFCMSGLSKVAALPQMKLGWILAGGPAKHWGQAFERLELIADTYLSVGAPVQNALPSLLQLAGGIQSQILERTRANLAFLTSSLWPGCPFRILHVEGGWNAIIQAPRVQSEEEWVLDLLESHNILVQPGFFYDFDSEAFLVVSLLTPEPVFRLAIARLLSNYR